MPSHTMEIIKSSHDAVTRARAFAHMSEAELRRAAARAANERDAQDLWALTEAYLTLHGDAGALASLHTYRAYRRGVWDLIEAWSDENLLRPSRDAAALWMRTLEAKGRKPATLRVKLAAGKALYKALRWAAATAAEPFADVRAARDPTAPWEKQGAYSRSELDAILKGADAYTGLVVLFGAHGGLRVAEMLNLKWSDIDLAERTIIVRHGKGGKRRTVNMSESLAGLLTSVAANIETGSSYVLPFRSRITARERLVRACHKAHVPFRGLHALRHSAGTRLQRETGNLSLVADHLGHATLDMARNYAKRDDEELKKAVDDW